MCRSNPALLGKRGIFVFGVKFAWIIERIQDYPLIAFQFHKT